MSKYTRHQSVINRESDNHLEEDHWLKQFQKNLEKSAVQSRQVDQSLFDQINNIMNGKSKYPSVSAAVEDMMQRSGLSGYLEKLSNQDNNSKIAENTSTEKTASDETPDVIRKLPIVRNTLENYIKETKGNISIPAIISKIRAIHKNDVSDDKLWEDEKLIKLVSELNLKEKSNNPSAFTNYYNLGSQDHMDDSELDPSNTDAFHALNPAKI